MPEAACLMERAEQWQVDGRWRGRLALGRCEQPPHPQDSSPVAAAEQDGAVVRVGVPPPRQPLKVIGSLRMLACLQQLLQLQRALAALAPVASRLRRPVSAVRAAGAVGASCATDMRQTCDDRPCVPPCLVLHPPHQQSTCADKHSDFYICTSLKNSDTAAASTCGPGREAYASCPAEQRNRRRGASPV